MPSLTTLIESRASAWAQAQEFRDRSDTIELSGEDEAAWRSALAEIDALTEQIELREKDAEIEQRFAALNAQTRDNEMRGTDTDSEAEYRDAFVAYMRGGERGLTAEQRSTLETRAQQTDTGAAGGYTVPTTFWAKVTEAQNTFGGVLGLVETITTDSGNQMQWATNDDTANVGEIVTEGSAVSALDIAFGSKALAAHLYSSKLIKVSRQLIQDSGLNIEDYVARKAGQRLARIQGQHSTIGTGSGQPQGFVTGATTGKTTASATAITFDELIDLEQSVDAAYRQNATYVLNDAVIGYVRKLKDTTGRYLWQPSLQVGVPPSINGYPVVTCNFMTSAITTGQKTVAFGDFSSAYVARNVIGGNLERLNELYAANLQVGFFAFTRFDALVQDASAVKLLVQA